MRGAVSLLVSCVFVAANAHAVSLVDQVRGVEVAAEVNLDGFSNDFDDDEVSATGFEPIATGDVVAVAGSEFGDFAVATANHDSTITENVPGEVIEAFGGGAAAVNYDIFDPGFPGSFAAGSGVSLFSLTFEVHSPTPFGLGYGLESELTTFGGTQFVPEAFITLEGLVGGVLLSDFVIDGIAGDLGIGTGDILFGTLPADTYRLTLGAIVDGIGEEDALGTGGAAYEFQLRVPEPSLWLLALPIFMWRRRFLPSVR